MRERGSILVGLLWCLALLSIVVVGVLHTSRLDLMVVKNHGDRIQAHYLALAGIEKAKALLYQNARDRSRNGKNHTGELYNAEDQFRDVALGRGVFRIFRRGRADEGSGMFYGVSDEESRLNVNNATVDQLAKLQGMASNVAAAIVSWHSASNQVTPGGVGSDYYNSLQPPRQARNGPVQTIRELLMVRDVSGDLLLGDDTHQNGGIDTTAAAGSGDNGGAGDTGWAAMLTADSSVDNVNAAGEDRVNIQSADETALTGVRGITAVMARAIVSYRGQNQFQSVMDLLDVTTGQNQNPATGAGTPGGQQGILNQPGGQDPTGQGTPGANVISDNLLMDVADDLTVDSKTALAGAININTAGLEVLMCLPGVDRDLAQAVISYRESSGYLPNVAWLLKVPGMTRDIAKQIAPLVTVRSETYRILCEGQVKSGGVRQRIQAIVHVGLGEVVTLSYREDDL